VIETIRAGATIHEPGAKTRTSGLLPKVPFLVEEQTTLAAAQAARSAAS
jgi:hypothetical protein